MLLDGVWFENLVRFPVERRSLPTFEMMCELAPDGRMIPHLLEALEIADYDPDLQDNADRAMAESVALMKTPDKGEARHKFFEAQREQAVRPAIDATIEAKRVADEAYRTSRRAIDAETEDPLNAYALGRLANRFLNTSARAALEAHRLCEIARGRCRALTLAEMREPWVPFDIQEEGAWLVEEGNRAMAAYAAQTSQSKCSKPATHNDPKSATQNDRNLATDSHPLAPSWVEGTRLKPCRLD